MTDEVEHLFHELADLSPEGRAQYFEMHPVDPATRREVEQLLAFSTAESTAIFDDIRAAAGEALSSIDPATGQRCGPFRLLHVLGRGGMGVVYLAERADGEVRQRAAVKLLQPWMSENLEERFLQERQILAGLSHPNIAHLLDAGRRLDGQPYLAMEYVEGRPIDEYAARLPLSAKLRLFLTVCEAVAYLHRNLVVHRDLKPSNILVNAEGQPKILDFGIAKLIDAGRSATVTAMALLTPDYASPEQVTGARIGTASDIYSLGAVLYHLLTGRSPHDFGDNPSPASIARIIAEGEVIAPGVSAPELKGDLEAILLKALRKDPLERYYSVDQFAADLENYLQGRPVVARPDTLLYRTRKFLRRHRWPVAGVSLAAAGLVVTSAIAVREAADARYRFDQVRNLARTLLFEFHDELDRVPGNIKAKSLLISTARDYLDNLSAAAGNDEALLGELAEAYDRLASVQGGASVENLNQRAAGLESRRRALAIRRRLATRSPADAGRLVHALSLVADDLRNLGRLEEAMDAAREAVSLSTASLSGGSSHAGLLTDASNAHMTYARVLQDNSRLTEAASEIETGERLLRTSLKGKFHRLLVTAAQDRADLLLALGRVEEAVRVLEQAEHDGDRLVAEASPGRPYAVAHRSRQFTYAALADAYDSSVGLSLENPAKALAYREKLCKGWQDSLLRDPNNAAARGDLAVCFSETALTLLKVDPAAAVGSAQAGVRIFEELDRGAPDDYLRIRRARAYTRLALAHLAHRQSGEANRAIERSLQLHRQLLSNQEDNPGYRSSLAWTLTASGRILHSLGRPLQARQSVREAISLAESLPGTDLQNVWITAEAHQAYGEFTEPAERCSSLRRVLDLWQESAASSTPLVQGRIAAARKESAGCFAGPR